MLTSKRGSPRRKTSHANLIRYKPSGTYYAHVRVKGKLLRKSLETTSVTVAQMKLADFQKVNATYCGLGPDADAESLVQEEGEGNR